MGTTATEYAAAHTVDSVLPSAHSHFATSGRAPLLKSRPPIASPTVRRASWHRRYVTTALIAEFLVALVVMTAFVARYVSFQPSGWAVAACVAVPTLWVLCLSSTNAYSVSRVGLGPEEYRAVGRAAVYLTAGVAITASLAETPLPSFFLTVAAPAILLGTLAVRRTMRLHLGRSREDGLHMQRAVVVGRGHDVAELIREIQQNPASTGLHVVAACVSDVDEESVESPVFGPPESALDAVDTLEADTAVVLSHPEFAGRSLRRLSWALADRSVELLVAPGIAEVDTARLSLQPRAGMSLLRVERPIMSGVKLGIKRVTDALLSLALVTVAVIPMIIISLTIWLNDRGPVFYRQERVGEFGELFSMFKFRTMVVDADERLRKGELDHVTRVNDKLFKDPTDPRITRVGRVLRRYSLDELPQLMNVVRGEMSLVGPRPPLSREVADYEPDESQRLRVRPGMTGLWQISGRSDLTWEQSVRLDLWYVDNWTPLFDLQVLARTGTAVLAKRGAY